MGLFDQILGAVLSGGTGGQAPQQGQGQAPGGLSAALPQLIMAAIAHEGGISGLMQKFQSAGMGDVMASWVGTGPNQPIQPGQIGSTLGQTTISDLARQAGVSEQDLLNGLAQALPGVIDKLTPHGRLPTAAELGMK